MSNLNQVFFIVNGNSKIGYGHVVRCELLANEFEKKNIDSIFLSYELEGNKNITSNQYPHQHFDNLDSLILFLTPKLNQNSFVAIDTDHDEIYNMTYQEQLISTKCKLMYITVKSELQFKSHFILNQNIIGFDNVYYTESYTKKMIGPSYFILDDKFQEIKPNPDKEKLKKILITCGNADPNNVTERVLKFLNEIPKQQYEYDVIIGGGNKRKEFIRNHSFCQSNSVNVIVDPSNMYSLMKNNDMAISTVGLTYWELVLHNIPTLLISGTEREREQIQYFCKNKYAYYLGDFDDENWCKKWKKNFVSFDQSKIKAGKLYDLIDVKGKTKVIEEVIKKYN